MGFLASFRLPDVGELFSEVEFPELQRDQAQELVTKYNKEGVDAGYGKGGSGRGGSRGGMRGRGGMSMSMIIIFFNIFLLLYYTNIFDCGKEEEVAFAVMVAVGHGEEVRHTEEFRWEDLE